MIAAYSFVDMYIHVPEANKQPVLLSFALFICTTGNDPQKRGTFVGLFPLSPIFTDRIVTVAISCSSHLS